MSFRVGVTTRGQGKDASGMLRALFGVSFDIPRPVQALLRPRLYTRAKRNER